MILQGEKMLVRFMSDQMRNRLPSHISAGEKVCHGASEPAWLGGS